MANQAGLMYVLELTQEIDIAQLPRGAGVSQLLFDLRTDMIDEYLTDFWIGWDVLCHTLGSDPTDPLRQVPFIEEGWGMGV